jgi:hypothetical protein
MNEASTGGLSRLGFPLLGERSASARWDRPTPARNRIWEVGRAAWPIYASLA